MEDIVILSTRHYPGPGKPSCHATRVHATTTDVQAVRRHLWAALKDEQHLQRPEVLELMQNLQNSNYRVCTCDGPSPLAELVVKAARWWESDRERREDLVIQAAYEEQERLLSAKAVAEAALRAQGLCPKCSGTGGHTTHGYYHAVAGWLPGCCQYCQGTGKYIR